MCQQSLLNFVSVPLYIILSYSSNQVARLVKIIFKIGIHKAVAQLTVSVTEENALVQNLQNLFWLISGIFLLSGIWHFGEESHQIIQS